MPPNRSKTPSAKQDLINSTPKLIKLLEERPLLWDTSDPYFYNLPERAEHWRDIAQQMYSNYDECNAEDKKQMILQIKTRWRHVRTAYVRHKKVPNLKKTSYIYDKEMAFYSSQGRSAYTSFNGSKEENCTRKLSKVQHVESNDDELTDTEMEHNESMKRHRAERKSRSKPTKVDNSSSQNNSMEEIYHEILIQESDGSNTEDDGFSYMYEIDGGEAEHLNSLNSSPTATESIKLETFHPMEQNSALMDDDDTVEDEQNKQSSVLPMVQIPVDTHELVEEVVSAKPKKSNKNLAIKAVKNLQQIPLDIDDDQCFFDSLKPALRDLDEDEKMDFRIEVMSILRDLKRK